MNLVSVKQPDEISLHIFVDVSVAGEGDDAFLVSREDCDKVGGIRDAYKSPGSPRCISIVELLHDVEYLLAVAVLVDKALAVDF